MGRRTDNPVGTYTLTAPERFTNHYEFAAWYQEIEVQIRSVSLAAALKIAAALKKGN